MGNFTTAIDFGSAKTVVAIGQKRENGIHIVFWESAPSEGVKFGEITNVTKCSRVLQGLLDKAREAIGEPVTEACVNISGRKIESTDEKVEMDRPFQSSAISVTEIKDLTCRQYRNAEDGKVVLEVAPQQYNVDDAYNVEFGELEGMRGKSIDASFKTFSGKRMLVDTREQVLQLCGVKMLKGILSPVASARAVLTEQEREKGVVLIDFGKDLTEISIVRNNILREVKVIPFAGESITKDIANVTDVSQLWAETVKVRHGYCLEEICPENKTLELINSDGEADCEIDLLLLTRIIEARVSEIFDAVKYLVSQNKYAAKLSGGYVLTGGSAYLGYILPLAKTILGAKVRLAAPRGCVTPDSVSGAFDAGSCTSVGLILEQCDPILSTVTGNAPVSRKPETKVTEPIEELTDPAKADGDNNSLFSFLRHKTAKPQPPKKEEKKEPKKEPKKENKKSTWGMGELFSDEEYGNKA